MEFRNRYARNAVALAEAETAALAEKRVCVAGAGGLGGFAVELLARVGVGEIRVIDGDEFEESNLNRQLLATERTIGAHKAAEAVRRIAEVNSQVVVDARCVRLDEGNARALVAGCDCVIDALDNPASRFWLAHACQEEGVPLVFGAISGWFGQVCTVFPGDVSFVTVYGQADLTEAEGSAASSGGEAFPSEAEAACSDRNAAGNLSFTAACMASHQAAEAVKVLLGKGDVLRNRLLMLDLLFGASEEVELVG